MSLITVPKKVYIAATSAEGSSYINAFDACLVKIGLPQVSLIKVTSILPRNIEIITGKTPSLPKGSNVPAIYAYACSDTPGETVSAAIAIAITNDLTLVAEHASVGAMREEVEEKAKNIVVEMARIRGLQTNKIIVRSATHVVKRIGCALAIVVEVE